MKSRIQSEIDRRRIHWTRQKLNCKDIHREIGSKPLWDSPEMKIEIKQEENEKTNK